jgi:hypothetical protein
MKLEEFVTKIYNERPELDTESFGPILNSKVLEEVKDELLKLDVFSECDDLEIVHYPIFKLGEDKVLTTQIHKYGEDIKYRGKCYLYSISLTPEMYEPSKVLIPVKDGASISPILYDPSTFEPSKKIVLTFSPEGQMDDETKKQEIRDLLNKVLDNPEEYKTKGTRGVLIRGVFEIVEDERKFEPNYLVGTIQESETYIGYYMVKEKGSNDKESLYIKSKQIPKKLKESFIEKFTEEGKLKETTEEELNQFLEENK